MGAGHNYPDKEYLLVREENEDTDFDIIYEDRENYFNLTDLNGFEQPLRMGEEENEVNVYLYKDVDLGKDFENTQILVGLKHDNYNTILVAQANDDFEDYDITENIENDSNYFFMEEYASVDTFHLYEELQIILGLFTEAVDGEYPEISTQKENEAKTRYKNIGQKVKDFFGVDTLLKMNTTNNVLYMEKVINEFYKIMAKNKDIAVENLQKEKIFILDAIVKGNHKGLFYKTTSSWTSEVATDYKTDIEVNKPKTNTP